MFAASTSLADVPEDKHVLVINSYHRGMPATDLATEGVFDIFPPLGDLRVSVEYLDTKRMGNAPAYLNKVAELLKLKYADARPDVVITTDNNALAFMVQRQGQLFPAVPVVFCGVNNFSDSMLGRRPFITGIVEEPDIKSNLALMTRLHPESNRILVICDKTSTGLANLAHTQREAQAYTDRIEFEYLFGGDMTLGQVLDRLARADEKTLVLLLDFFLDANGQYLEPIRTAEAIAATSPRPVYTHAELFMGHGPVGGKTTSGRLGGKIAASMARKILSGTAVDQLPINRQSPTVYMFDASRLEAFGIDPEEVPAGSVLLNCQRSFYERYRSMVWTVVLVVTGLLGAVVVLSISIAGRRRAERELLRQRGLLRHVIDHIPHAVWWKDIAGRYLGANREFARQMQLSDPELALGKTRKELAGLTGDGGIRLNQIETPLEEPAEEIIDLERTVEDRGGESVFILGKLSLRDEKGQVIGMVGLSSDVTHRVRLERELGQARKMEAIGQLAGGVAHDFNNLLTVIGGNAEILCCCEQPPEDWGQLAREIQEAATRASDLTSQLLTYARQGPMEKRNIDLRDLLGETVGLLSRSIEKRIEIVADIPEEPMVVRGDATQLQSVMLNLALNARDAIEGKGSIRFEIQPVELDRRSLLQQEVEDLGPGSYVKLSVTDSGVGMDAETLSKIFDPFFTTKQRGRGTGLGLSVVYGAIKSHGGTIVPNSSPGEGTRIDMLLPRCRQKPDETFKSTSAEDLPAGQGNILLVDDEQSVAGYARRVLESLGYAVTYCGKPSEALELLQQGGEFNLAIIDVVMPDMNGPELTRHAARLAPEMPVLWISGYSEEAVRNFQSSSEHPPLLAKPFTAEQLARTVAELIHIASRQTS